MAFSEMTQGQLWSAYIDTAIEMDDAFVSGNYDRYLECKETIRELDKYIED